MFELNRTQARWAFKDLLGQANHFLITILVGLDGVRAEKVELSPEFHTSWNPQSIARSADRSRVFVLDLALIRAIDAFDTYMMTSAQKPSTISSQEFKVAMDASGRSVARRLEVFDQHLSSLGPHHKAILSIAINWRNQRVHSLSSDSIKKQTLRTVQDNAEFFKSGYSGLDVDDFISHFKSKEAPTFKEAASVIRLVHEAVSHYDAELLQNLPIERYLKEALLKFLETDNANPLRSIKKTWDHPEKKRTKVIRLLRMIGVNQTDEIKGRLVPDEFVDALVNLKSGDVLSFLQN